MSYLEREREFRVQLDEILADLEARRLELSHVVLELEVAHGRHRLLDSDEVVDLLFGVERGPHERHRLHLPVGTELPKRALAELPAHRRPVGAPRVEAVDQAKLAVHLEDRDAVHIVRPRVEELHAEEAAVGARSEEHTSELQSLAYLVCRLLLEKKKNNTYSTTD